MKRDTLAVIPARSGSKRLPGKNVVEVDGKPLIAHAIEQAEAADNVDRVIVSTEDDEIGRVAEEWGGEVPFKRPPDLATDEATADEAVLHALEYLRETGETFDIVCMLLVTTPFRTPEDIDDAIGTLAASGAQSIVTTVAFDHPPMYAISTNDDGFLYPYFGDEYLWEITRSQEYPDLRRPNGAVFAATVDAFKKFKSFYTDKTLESEMPPSRSLDIDEPFDLRVARALINLDEGAE